MTLAFGCDALKLAVLSSLAREKIIAPLPIDQLRAAADADDDSEDGADPVFRRIARVIEDRSITAADVAKLHELHWPEQPTGFEPSGRPHTTLQEALHPRWSGEDEVFDLSKLDGLERCTALVGCHLGLLTTDNVGVLQKLPGLQRVSLDCRGKAPNLKPLAKLLSLRELSISCARDLSALTDLPNLQKLELTYAKVADLAPLATLPALKSLTLWWSQPDDDLRDLERRSASVIKKLKARKVKLRIEWPEIDTAKPKLDAKTKTKTKAKAKAKAKAKPRR